MGQLHGSRGKVAEGGSRYARVSTLSRDAGTQGWGRQVARGKVAEGGKGGKVRKECGREGSVVQPAARPRSASVRCRGASVR